MSAGRVLIGDAARSWFRAKGFWIVLVAALVPPLLTGSWALTHQQDVSPTEITYSPDTIRSGDQVNITATITNVWDEPAPASNATLEVGFFENNAFGDTVFRSRASETFRIPALRPDEAHRINMTWTAEAGTFIFQVRTDTEDEVLEIEENNNHRFVQVQVAFPEPAEPPAAPDVNGTGNATGTTDLAVTAVSWEPQEVYQNSDANVTVTVENRGATRVENATVTMEVFRALAVGFTNDRTDEQTVSLEAGANETIRFTWRPSRIATYAVQGSIVPPEGIEESHQADNTRYQGLFVDRRFLYEEPEEKATAKEFYRTVLEVLHIRLLIPLLALFYAGSMLEEERRKGNLSYILARPVPRWMLPVTRSLVSLVVAGVAIAAGIVATFLLLLGMPQEAPGFLWNPLLLTLLALFAYTGLWTALGVLVQRPTLWGLLWVLGWESFIFAGREMVTVNGEPLLADWFLNLSLAHWMTKALDGWDAGTGWAGGSATTAVVVVAAIGVGGILVAAWAMQRREFPE